MYFKEFEPTSVRYMHGCWLLFTEIDLVFAAYAHVALANSFFSSIAHTTKKFIKCKVNIKLCLTALHSLSTVEKFHFSVDVKGSLFRVQPVVLTNVVSQRISSQWNW